MSNPKRKAVIVGVAESHLGRAPEGTSALDIMATATIRALEDAGLALSEVDGIFAAASQLRTPAMGLAEYLQLPNAYLESTSVGGSSFMLHLQRACEAIEAGRCKTVVIAYGSTQRSAGRSNASPPERNPYETPFRPFLPPSAYALAAARHMYEYGTTREQLAEVAVAARKWAQLNPVAWEKTPLTIDEVLSSPMISEPLTIRDCCLVNDGGGAIVVTSADRAAVSNKPAVYPLGFGHCTTHASISSMADLTVTGALQSGRQAYSQAGLSASDIDVAMLYDAFTINTLLFLEDLGFCSKGEGGRFVADGTIAPGGALPVNTNGGGLSYCHPGMYGLLLLVEAVRQLRGECGDRQVKDAHIALAHGNGGVLSSQATVLLGHADVLKH